MGRQLTGVPSFNLDDLVSEGLEQRGTLALERDELVFISGRDSGPGGPMVGGHPLAEQSERRTQPGDGGPLPEALP